MKKGLLLCCLAILAVSLRAAPTDYHLKTLPAGSAITVDGDLSEWNDSYFVDSIRGETNVFYRDPTITAWLPTIIQYQVLAALDDNNFYCAIKVIRDGNIVVGGTYGSDCIKINPGGQAAAFYVWSNNTIKQNPSNPYTIGVDLNAVVNATGNGTVPTYEFSIARSVLDQFGLGSWQISVGMEDNDLIYLAVGVEYSGDKGDHNQWDNPIYYPTWFADGGTGDPTSVETKSAPRLSAEQLMASPNPFMPSTLLSYNARSAGTLKIYDVNGKAVHNFQTKAGLNKVQWNGTDMNGKGLSSGIYIARLVSGDNVLNRQLFLTR